MTDERRIDRMAGCACLGKGMIAAGAIALAIFCLLMNQGGMTDRGSDPLSPIPLSPLLEFVARLQ